MKNFLAFYIISALAFLSYANSGEESFKVNPGGTVSVHMSSSDITINIWQKNELLVRTPGDEELKITNRNGVVKIESGSAGYADHIIINIPALFNVKINTGAGDLKINGDLRGNLELNNSGGDIEFRNISGRAVIQTGGGNIHGSDINGNIDLKSSGGDIRIGSVKGRTSIVTGGGNINLNNASNIELISTSGGNIMIRDASGNGEISTGGGNIEIYKASGNLNIQSYGGDIRINELSGKILTKTGGGVIRIKKLSGSLDANTMSGEISVNFSKASGKSKLHSGNGNIRLGAAGGLKARIIARTKDSNWWKDESTSEEDIKSDFKVTTLKRDKRKQEVETVYEINGGGPVIELFTNYGDIYIRKID